MSVQTRLRRAIFREGTAHPNVHSTSESRPAVAGAAAVHEGARGGSVALLVSPRVPEPEPAPAREVLAEPEVTSRALYGAVRLDPSSFCLRVTVPRESTAVAAGYSFRLTLTRSPEAPPADVAVSDWPDLVVDQRASSGGRLAALPGDSVQIASGDTWTYDIRTTTALGAGIGRTMRFAETPTGRGWTATFVELDAGGEPIGAVQTHTF